MQPDKPESRIAAIFDLDLTITSRDSFKYFIIWEHLYHPINWRYFPSIVLYGILRKFRLIPLQTFKEKSLTFLKNKTKQSIYNSGRLFFEVHLNKYIRSQARETIDWHKKRNHQIIIATSSPDIYIKPLSDSLSCSAYVCSTLAYRNHLFIGRFSGKDCLGDNKLEAVIILSKQLTFDLKLSYAYSDHESDLPILESVKKAIAVNPTKKLQNIANSKRWDIKHW